jgi:hypothetical protein
LNCAPGLGKVMTLDETGHSFDSGHSTDPGDAEVLGPGLLKCAHASESKGS